MFVLLAFSITSFVSVAFAISATTKKKWRDAVIYVGASMIPVCAWNVATVTNSPGWEAVMGV